jgi:hypothetical protein
MFPLHVSGVHAWLLVHLACSSCGKNVGLTERASFGAGYDFPWMLQNIIPFGLWGGSVRHDAHHLYGTVYYQKFFTYIDTFLGTTVDSAAGLSRLKPASVVSMKVC